MTPRSRTARAAGAAELALGGLALGGLAVALAAATAATVAAFRATAAERRRALPGDALVPEPLYVTTQAVTIDAPPEQVWPWLAQMGADRAGWYSYGRIDNGGRPSAAAILPAFQRVVPGDVFPATPGATDAFVVAAVDPPRDLVLAVPAAGGPVMTWEFCLDAPARGRTRLIVRARLSPRWRARAATAPDAARRAPLLVERAYGALARLPGPLLLAAGGLGHRVMQNQQLRGIRRRAESGARRTAAVR